jgi:endonuclease/exonuclease/phosphatase family metal-dependent hydrolase
MLALVTALVLTAEPARVRLERVDVLSEDPGLWLSQEAPRLGVDALTPAVRFLTQVKVVWSTPVRGLGFGVSVESQSLVYEYPLLREQNLALSMGLQTHLLLPRGALLGVAWRAGPVRLGLSLRVFSKAT